MLTALIDAGPIIAYFDADDRLHAGAQKVIGSFRGQLITTTPIITEVMWYLRRDYRVQNQLLLYLSRGLFRDEGLTDVDYIRIAELSEQYSDLPADFGDLSLVSVAERLDLSTIISIDREFDIYRRQRGRESLPFKRIQPGLG